MTHPMHLLLGVGAPLLLVALVLWHFAAGRPAYAWPARLDRQERGRQRSIRAHARDLAAGPAQLATLVDLTTWDDDRDDAQPVDMAALMVEQDMEIGREFARWVEQAVALETAVSFGYIRLPDVPVRSGAPR